MNAGAVASSLTAGMGEEVSSAPLGEGLRANTYSLLGALLAAPPSHALIDLLKRITPAEAGAEGELAPAWEVLRLAAERASVASLDDEYHELFVGIGRGELVRDAGPRRTWKVGGPGGVPLFVKVWKDVPWARRFRPFGHNASPARREIGRAHV